MAAETSNQTALVDAEIAAAAVAVAADGDAVDDDEYVESE